jgi:hypothetical protein
MPWRKMLAYLTGTVDQELLLRNEYLATENRILRSKIKGRLLLTDPERITLARVGKGLGRKALKGLSAIVRPDTILAWHQGRSLGEPRENPAPETSRRPSELLLPEGQLSFGTLRPLTRAAQCPTLMLPRHDDSGAGKAIVHGKGGVVLWHRAINARSPSTSGPLF